MAGGRAQRSGTFLFEGFRFDGGAGELFRIDQGGACAPVTLGSRAVDLLGLLLDRHGRLVSKDEIMDMVWHGTIVEEANLTVQIAALRRILDRNRTEGSCIKTVSGRGYRFVAPVATEVTNEIAAAPPRIDAAREPAPTPHHDAERRQIAAMSCELIRMSGRADGADLEKLRETVGAFQRCVAETVRRHDGFIVSRLGNSVLVIFGYPAAHEHDAEQAVRAGLELCAAVRTLRCEAEPPMRCRVGIATGMAIIGDLSGGGAPLDREIIGDAPNLAGRLQLLAQPGTVTIEPATRQLLGNLFDCRELRSVDAASGSEPTRVWQVLDESIVATRFEALHPVALTPLVGREEELSLIHI